MKMARSLASPSLVLLMQGMVCLVSMVTGSFIETGHLLICEHSSAYSLRCSAGRFINVTYAMYGRLNNSYCPTSTSVNNCRSPLSMQVVSRSCHGRTSCLLEASNSHFGDPCVGILKYLEVSYSCLSGSEFTQMPRLPDGYVYNNQVPLQAVLQLNSSSTELKVAPFTFRIYDIIESDYTPKDDVFPSAIEFLSTQPKANVPTGSICYPKVSGISSNFCVLDNNNGQIFTSQTFIPGLYPGMSYDIKLVARDSSPLPFVGKTSVRIAVVPKCFPLVTMYNQMRTNCPSDSYKFTFPAGLPWSNALYGRLIPISITSPVTIAKIFIDISLLANFKSHTLYRNYEISLAVSGGVFIRRFVYVPSGLAFKEERVVQVTGTKLNITLDPPIRIAAGQNYANISLKLTDDNTVVEFNTENAVSLYGASQISICPDSTCMVWFRRWQSAVEKIKYTKNSECIEDESLQEAYLQPCNSDQCYRKFDVSLLTPGGTIIYHFREQGHFQRFQPTFYRVIGYKDDFTTHTGYSLKYFCGVKPYDDSRRFICLNRYAGRLRVRSTSSQDFRNLSQGVVFSIEIQAEATINNTLMLDRCLFDIRLTAPMTTSTMLPVLSTSFSPSTSSSVTHTQATTTAHSLKTAPHSSIITSSSSVTTPKPLTTAWLISSTSYIGYYPTSTPITTMITTTKPSGSPTFKESLEVIAPKIPLLSQPLNITCTRTSGHDSAIQWYKDGQLLQKTGRSLIIDSPRVEDQGRYHCRTLLFNVVITSDKKLVTFKDVFTSSVYLEILNREFTAGLTDSSSAEFKALSEEVVQVTKNAIKSLQTTQSSEVKVEKFSKGSVIAQVLIASPIRSSESLTSYYATLSNLLISSANANDLGTLQIPAAGIIVVNKENCLSETTNQKSSKGPYTWPAVRSGETASVPCSNGPPMVNATRECKGNFDGGAFWGAIVDSKCNFNSKRTSELNSLSETTINATNAESVSSELNTLTKNATSLTSDDAVLASQSFTNLVNSNVTSDIVIDDMLNIASNLLRANETTLAASQVQDKSMTGIIKGLESIADRIKLPNKTGEAVVKISSGVAIQAMRLNKDTKKTLNFGLRSSSISSNSIVSNENFKPDNVDIGLELPASFYNDVNLQGEARISFVVYSGNQFFQTTKRNVFGERVIDFTSQANSKVISAHVAGKTRVNLSQPLEGTFKKNLLNSSSDSCVFWDFNINDGYGGWSREGCRKTHTENGRVICQCDHMTNFAIIFDPYAGKVREESETHEKILGIISFIGIGISIGGLFLTLLTLFLFRRLRRSLPPKLLIHLSSSLILTLICFVAGADRTESIHMCRAFAILIQYFMLATFCWMSVEAINLYLSFVIVMGSYISRFLIKAAIYAWGLPAVIVAITASVRISDYGNERNCIVSGWAAYGSLFIPVCLILVINFVILIRVFQALRSSANGKKVTKDQQRSPMSQLRIAITFSTILGLTWVFGAFAVGDGRLAFQYLFCIFNSLQGFAIFYLHVARHNDARNHWIHLLTGKGLNYHRATISSSSNKTMKSAKLNGFNQLTKRADSTSGTLTSSIAISLSGSPKDFESSLA